ncbi:MAG: peptidoglycan DD-metalloendopeptidase family protein [Thermoleophilia bacterium]|nr:peptidoglycan DD-metalloendopeptidase family protein [Thermoleophilia bacterium]
MMVERVLRTIYHLAEPVAPRASPPMRAERTSARGRGVSERTPVRSGALRALVAGLLLATLALFLGSGAVFAASDAAVVPILFPLEQKVAWTDTFGAPRSGGRTHEGNDIMVPKMTPLLAVVGGTLDWMNLSGKTSSYNGLPYYNILLRGDDGNDYFYIHMNNDTPGTDDGLGGTQYAYAPGLSNGTHVKAGQLIGWAGDSGNAEEAGSQLHFEIHLGGYKNPIDPYNSLKAALTYQEWIDAGGGPLGPPPSTSTTTPPTTTSTTVPTTTTVPSTTAPPTPAPEASSTPSSHPSWT